VLYNPANLLPFCGASAQNTPGSVYAM
jgi:hypothetical protein